MSGMSSLRTTSHSCNYPPLEWFLDLYLTSSHGDVVRALIVCFPLMYPGAADTHAPVHFHENMTSPQRQQKLSLQNSQMLNKGEQRNGRPLLDNESDNAASLQVFVWSLYKFSWGSVTTEWFGRSVGGQKMCWITERGLYLGLCTHVR